jgi:putative aminopeptidase FrvX
VEPATRQFLNELLTTPGISGDEQRVQAKVRKYAESFCDVIETDCHGNLILGINPNSKFKVMLAGHADQIGMLVSHIDDQGFLSVQTVGGWDPQQLIGQRVQIWTQAGGVPGVISRKPIHLLDESERNTVVKVQDMWIDIGAANAEETRRVVQIGDPVTLQLGYQELMGEKISSVALDDRVGVWTVVEALRRAKERGASVGVYAVSTVAEEIGLRGATTSAERLRPNVGIAVDVTHATDCPTIDKRQQGVVALGKGPVIVRGPNMNPVVVRRLMNVANQGTIAYQVTALGRAAPNDSNAIQISGQGVATGLVAIPNRYMHSAVEVCHLADIQAAAELLGQFCASLQEDDCFVPQVEDDQAGGVNGTQHP